MYDVDYTGQQYAIVQHTVEPVVIVERSRLLSHQKLRE